MNEIEQLKQATTDSKESVIKTEWEVVVVNDEMKYSETFHDNQKTQFFPKKSFQAIFLLLFILGLIYITFGIFNFVLKFFGQNKTFNIFKK